MLHFEYRSHVRFGGEPINWRERLADVLRRLVDKIDGRLSIAFSAQTTPPLNSEQILDSLRAGHAMTAKSIDDYVRAEHHEIVLQFCRRDLYGAEPFSACDTTGAVCQNRPKD